MMISFTIDDTEDDSFPYEVHLSMKDASMKGDWLERNRLYQLEIEDVLEWLKVNVSQELWIYYDLSNSIFFKREVDIVALKLRWE